MARLGWRVHRLIPANRPRPNRSVARIVSYFLPYWRLVLLGFGCIAAESLLGLVPALVTRQLVDSLAGRGHSFSSVASLIVAGLGAMLTGSLVEIAHTYLSTRISQSLMFDLRRQLFDRLLGQPVEFFTSTRTGDVMSRMSNDIGAIQSIVNDTAFGLVTNVLVASTTLALMLALDWRLSPLALALLPAAIVPALRAGRAVF